MMHAGDDRAAIARQAVHERQIPQRVDPVHDLAEKITGERFQFRVGAMFEGYFTNVSAEVEIGIVIPG